MSHTLIFDIGKTNKKIFVFDEALELCHSESITFPEIEDEEGFPCDDIEVISDWMKATLNRYIQEGDFNIQYINISAYGASMVYVGEGGKVLTPLYNYLKPFPQALLNQFHEQYGSPMEFARESASPPLQMLNSGLQIFRLKYTRPEIYSQVKWALHLPQYFFFLLSGKAVSEYTSIGCHTGLWEYDKKSYHKWVDAEKINEILPPIVSAYQYKEIAIQGKLIPLGVGIHDSSAALIPYLRKASTPFALLSTGTWSIAFNPFTQENLSSEDLQNDCLQFLRPDGHPVKAARLFLGNEHKLQVEKMCTYYEKPLQAVREMNFVEALFHRQNDNFRTLFHFESICPDRLSPLTTQWESFTSFDQAYHQLVLELVKEQAKSLDRAIGKSLIDTLYIDGGFAGNEVFVNILGRHYPKLTLNVSDLPTGSALGAAMAIHVNT